MEYADVIIVGAGLSGIGAAHHLQEHCPDRSYLILEGRPRMGGTWDLFRYPGIRSDSDMHTLGYHFRPWREAKAIADGPAILDYVRNVASEEGIDRRIRYRYRVIRADWDSGSARWTLTVERGEEQEAVKLQCNFLLMCSGYYSYDKGHEPEFPGRERFAGKVIHPQHWPEDLDYDGQKVVIIGSGATAMTLGPAMSGKAEKVTMLQRSPTWVVSRPEKDRVANFLRRVLPERWAYALTRWKNVAFQQYVYRRSRTHPEKLKRMLLKGVRRELGPGFDVEKHFTPDYDPWDQRLCLVPEADLFRAIRGGQMDVVTDHIETFTEKGIRTRSGDELEADIIVTATGLNLVVLGNIDFRIDGEPVDFSQTWAYKGMMFSGVPNLIFTFGYINASWTLRADLNAAWACRLLNHMKEQGVTQCVPELREQDRQMSPRPFIDDFSANYMQRVMHRFPRQGDHAPWLNTQDYRRDREMLRREPVDDGVLRFSGADRERQSRVA